jgi:hypothetical protein
MLQILEYEYSECLAMLTKSRRSRNCLLSHDLIPGFYQKTCLVLSAGDVIVILRKEREKKRRKKKGKKGIRGTLGLPAKLQLPMYDPILRSFNLIYL